MDSLISSHGRLATFARLVLIFQLAFLASIFSRSAQALPNNRTSKRVVYYYQTGFTSGPNGTLISLLPLIAKQNLDEDKKPFTTDVLVGAFHLGPQTDGSEMHLNDFPPNDTRYDKLWKQTVEIQTHGINVNLFLGGYQDQSFVRLTANFSVYYPTLKKTLETYKFNGIDLDVEDGAETTEQLEKLINQLRTDFGEDFIITLAPVASDLMAGGGGLSFVNYTQLFHEERKNISWFNVQFYSGFGTLADPSGFQSIVNNTIPPDVIVAGMLANPLNGGGFVDIATVNSTVTTLVKQFPTFGGVDAWEYFDALPGGTPKPAEWGTYFGKAMGVQD